MPSPCPPRPPRPSVDCTRCPGNPMGRMQIRGTNEAASCLPSQFTLMMTNTFVHGEGRWELQYASNHRPPSLTPPPPINISFSPLSFFSLFFLSFFQFVNNKLYPSFHSWMTASPTQLTPRTADVAVVCERSVLSKQTHWAICYSTLHQAGSSEESAHHFNQPRRHTMNL